MSVAFDEPMGEGGERVDVAADAEGVHHENVGRLAAATDNADGSGDDGGGDFNVHSSIAVYPHADAWKSAPSVRHWQEGKKTLLLAMDVHRIRSRRYHALQVHLFAAALWKRRDAWRRSQYAKRKSEISEADSED